MTESGVKLPSELDQPLPRVVGEPTSDFKSIKFSGGLFFLFLLVIDVFVYANNLIDLNKLILSIFGGVAFCSLVTWGYIRQYNTEKDIIKYGHATRGKIIGEEVHGSRQRGPELWVTYEFTDAHGKIVRDERGGFQTRNFMSEADRKEFAKITKNPIVLYDPKDSSKNILYPAQYATCRLPSV